MSLESLFHQVTSPNRSFYMAPMYWVLCWVSWVYALIQKVRALGYARGLVSSHKLRVPVISIGNLTLGGTGKTPTVLWLAEALQKMGRHPAILSRGYGSETEETVNVVSDGKSLLLDPAAGGDEPVMLARRLPTVPVLSGRRRYPLGVHAEQELGADVMILDDGFQHLALQRDLNILLIDHRSPLGNGHVFPAGALREPPRDASRRADAVIITRYQEGEPELELKELLGIERPVMKTRMVPGRLVNLNDGSAIDWPGFEGKRVAAFCGIAQPSDFFETLSGAGMDLCLRQEFPDHFDYEGPYLNELMQAAESKGAEAVITTEKDAVKIEGREFPLPVWYVEMRLEFVKGEEVLLELIKGLAHG